MPWRTCVTPWRGPMGKCLPVFPEGMRNFCEPDWTDVPAFAECKGTERAKRTRIAAAGRAQLLFRRRRSGNHVAKRLPGILPPMTRRKTLETVKFIRFLDSSQRHAAF